MDEKTKEIYEKLKEKIKEDIKNLRGLLHPESLIPLLILGGTGYFASESMVSPSMVWPVILPLASYVIYDAIKREKERKSKKTLKDFL